MNKKIEISKIERVESIQEILKKSGKVTSKIIKERLCIMNNIEIESYTKQALSRDLLYLEERGIIEVDESSHPKTYCLSGNNSKIVGENYLVNLGGLLVVPPHLKNELSLSDHIKNINPQDEFCLCFEISGNFLLLKINKEGLPLKICLSRTTKESATELQEDLEKAFGKRAISFQVPMSKISSISPPGKLGHLLIDLKSENEVVLTDLKSTNGTKVSSIDKEFALEMIKSGALTGQKTITEAWSNTLSKKVDLKKLEPITPIKDQGPLFIELGNQFPLLIF